MLALVAGGLVLFLVVVALAVGGKKPEATPTPPPMAATANCPSGMKRIPSGTFKYGDDKRDKTLPSFCMDTTEVTVDAYKACPSCSAPDSTGSMCNWGKSDRGNHPINCVDWNQATAYCASVTKRLPTEEEWEYAARGADGRKYPWGDTEPSNQLCWDGEGNDLGKGKRMSTCPVSSYAAGRSPFGLDDMSGNVWEWTSTLYDANKTDRVLRGGSWIYVYPAWVRASYRYINAPTLRISFVGFRCLRAD
jgi:formylglycine-generating enzyme required for sulfatase activity